MKQKAIEIDLLKKGRIPKTKSVLPSLYKRENSPL
jgi:hypothetical protein